MKYFSLLLGIILSGAVLGQAGSIDPTFNPGDIGFASGAGPDYHVQCMALQPDGKLIIGGDFYGYNAHPASYLARINPDGLADTSFPDSSTGPNGAVKKVEVLPNGKILIAGDFNEYDGQPRNGIARVNGDGSLDTSFDPGLGFNGWFSDMAVQADGGVLVVGYFYEYDGVPVGHIFRIDDAGELDTSLEWGLGPDNEVTCIELLDDGSFIIGGYFWNVDGFSRQQIAKYYPDGSLNFDDFGDGVLLDGTVLALAAMDDGSIMAGGYFQVINGHYSPKLCRFNATGAVDVSFVSAPDGDVYDEIRTIAETTSGVVVGGYLYYYDGNFTGNYFQVGPTGQWDQSFTELTPTEGFTRQLLVLPNGNIMVASDYDLYGTGTQKMLMRLLPTGERDITFNSSTGANDSAWGVQVLADGDIFITGYFTDYNSVDRAYLARLNPDGSLDESFDADMEGVNGYWVSNSLVLPDGSVLAIGNYGECGLFKFTPVGTLDKDFNQCSPDAEPNQLSLMPDGRIAIAGYFTNVNNNYSPGLAVLQADGYYDPSFAVGNGLMGNVNALVVQADGRLLVAGSLYSYNDVMVSGHIIRINTDGTQDMTFGTDSYIFDEVTCMVADGQGGYLVGGYYYDFAEYQYVHGIVRLDANGNFDITLYTPNPLNAPVRSILPRPDGSFIAVTLENDESGPGSVEVYAFSATGIPLPNFACVPDNGVYGLALDANGNIMMVGSFTSINGVGRNRVARVFGNGNPGICANLSLTVLASGNPVDDISVELFPYTGSGQEQFQTDEDTDVNGLAYFLDTEAGQYQCRAVPNPAQAGQQGLLSTYTNGTYIWNDAEVITVTCGTDVSKTIDLIVLPPAGIFPGTATGVVRYMTDPPGMAPEGNLPLRSFFTGDPIPGVVVVAERDTATGASASGIYFAFQQAVTGPGGEFEFENLPTGHYRLYVDMPGLPLAETHLFHVTATDEEFDGLNFYVNPNDAIYINDVIGVEEITGRIGITAFPNPFTEGITVRVAGGEVAVFDLFAPDGRTAAQGNVGSGGYISLAYLPAGVYVLRITGADGTGLFRVVKQ